VARLARVMVVCSDLERSKQFYRTILELPVTSDAVTYAELDLGDATLVLYPANDMLPVRRGSVQFGFTVGDVDTFVTDARTAGVTILQEPYRERWGSAAVIADPDGYPIRVEARVGTQR
jgi:catechol 2,3-dioxygenase-like lactoylglutathione lyase family enzyme